jgi:hypothetical protein
MSIGFPSEEVFAFDEAIFVALEGAWARQQGLSLGQTHTVRGRQLRRLLAVGRNGIESPSRAFHTRALPTELPYRSGRIVAIAAS